MWIILIEVWDKLQVQGLDLKLCFDIILNYHLSQKIELIRNCEF
jgi:hypothetical protein